MGIHFLYKFLILYFVQKSVNIIAQLVLAMPQHVLLMPQTLFYTVQVVSERTAFWGDIDDRWGD